MKSMVVSKSITRKGLRLITIVLSLIFTLILVDFYEVDKYEVQMSKRRIYTLYSVIRLCNWVDNCNAWTQDEGVSLVLLELEYIKIISMGFQLFR